MRDPRICQIQEHLYRGLAIMDLVGQTDELHTLWRRDSVAYAMRLAFHEWQAADDLLSGLEEDQYGCWRGRSHRPRRRPSGPGGSAEEPPNGRPQP